jgi:carbonic anhydrase/acetyltransferase-like protein (isoleucine patch superfamily)
MTNFALTSASNPQAVIQSLNYALSNLGSVTGNVLAVSNNGSIVYTSGAAYSYLYRYLWVAYGTSATGANFSFSPTNATYYGVRSNSSAVESTNPADYTWTQVSPAFGTNNYLWYITYGGGQINFAVSATAPSSQYRQVVDNQAIDLYVVTAAVSANVANGITATTSPSQILFAQNADQTYTANTQAMSASFFSNASSVAYGNITATLNTDGTVSIAEVAVDPSISVYTTYSATDSNSLTINFVQNTGAAASGAVLVQTVANSGISTFTVNAYTLANATPATPTANTGSWNFGTSMGTAPTATDGNIWTLVQPSITTSQAVYISSATASTSNATPTANVTNLTWSTPVISSGLTAPNMTIAYAKGQYITDNGGTYNPTAVGGVVTLTANVQALRGNTILAAVTQDTLYFTANGGFTVQSDPTTAFNANALVFGTPISTTYNLYQNVSYADVGGTVTNFISEALLVNGTTGSQGPPGLIPLAFIVANTDPTTANTSVLTAMFEAPRSNTLPPIGVGVTPTTNDVAQFFYPNINVAGGGVTSVLEYTSGNVWSAVNAQVVSGDVIYTGTITAAQLNADSIYTINLQSTNAQLGNTSSAGFWLASNTGSARFGGSVYVGDELIVGNNAVFGTNVYVGDSSVIGNNVVVGNNLIVGNNAIIGNSVLIGNGAAIGDSLVVGNNAVIGTNLTVGNNAVIGRNLTVGNNAVIGGNLTVSGLINGGSLAANVVNTINMTYNSVTTNQIAGNSVTTNQIAYNTISVNNLGPSVLALLPQSFGSLSSNSSTTLTGTSSYDYTVYSGDALIGYAKNLALCRFTPAKGQVQVDAVFNVFYSFTVPTISGTPVANVDMYLWLNSGAGGGYGNVQYQDSVSRIFYIGADGPDANTFNSGAPSYAQYGGTYTIPAGYNQMAFGNTSVIGLTVLNPTGAGTIQINNLVWGVTYP